MKISKALSRKIHIGTSGWHYDHWTGPFYPENLSPSDYFGFYAKHFNSVEINNSFYRLPDKKTIIHWRDTSPPGFIFTVKASRYITHMKKLKRPDDSLKSLLERVSLLEEKLGVILFQLPPRWHLNLKRLEDFLNILPGEYRYAFEFRDPSWFESSVYEALAQCGAAFCIYDFRGCLSAKEVTADFIYFRFHGPNPDAYRGKYDRQFLAGWAEAFSNWSKKNKEIFCYFDNDEAGFAVQNALELQSILT
jgi:uncharacterized protein YecE (DUF72 family)